MLKNTTGEFNNRPVVYIQNNGDRSYWMQVWLHAVKDDDEVLTIIV